jgi:hypothetical protein
MSMKHGCNDEGEKKELLEKNQFHCYFVHHKSQMDWPWNEHRLTVTGWQLTT